MGWRDSPVNTYGLSSRGPAADPDPAPPRGQRMQGPSGLHDTLLTLRVTEVTKDRRGDLYLRDVSGLWFKKSELIHHCEQLGLYFGLRHPIDGKPGPGPCEYQADYNTSPIDATTEEARYRRLRVKTQLYGWNVANVHVKQLVDGGKDSFEKDYGRSMDSYVKTALNSQDAAVAIQFDRRTNFATTPRQLSKEYEDEFRRKSKPKVKKLDVSSRGNGQGRPQMKGDAAAARQRAQPQTAQPHWSPPPLDAADQSWVAEWSRIHGGAE